MSKNETPLWEVFIRPRNGLSHKHCGSLHAADAELALQAARDVPHAADLGVGVAVGNAVRTSLIVVVSVTLLVSLSIYGSNGNFNLSG